MIYIILSISLVVNMVAISIISACILYGFRLIKKGKDIDFIWNGFANRNNIYKQ